MVNKRIALTAFLLLACIGFLSPAAAQVTTANLRGIVESADDKTPMAEVEVTLIHIPSGASQTATTNAAGSFAFTNLRVGGPYTVRAEQIGFQPVLVDNISLSAGKTRDVTLGLKLQTEVIEVEGAAVARNTSNRTAISAAEIDSLPSVGRDVRDFVRRTPEASLEGPNRTLSIGGANNRYNSVTIDGVRNDDDFGLNLNGLPTRRSPISLSAIEELAVESSPFDVRYGKFLGGNVNIVTKSGTNEWKGQLVGTYTSDALLGTEVRGSAPLQLDFSEVRYGATVGGPIVKDKLFFLLSAEGLSATRPVDAGVAGSGAVNVTSRVSAADLAEAQRISREIYGFDAGVPARSNDELDLKLLGKVDWAINKQHRASAIYQRTGGNQIQPTTSTDQNLPLSSNWYDAEDTLHTFSGRVFSNWTDQLSTEFEASGKIVTSRVDPLGDNEFMQATITTADGGRIILGPDVFRHNNELDNNTLHGKGEVNYLLERHLLTGGIEYERLAIRNLFVPRSRGDVAYNSLAAFEARTPASIRYQNSVTLDPEDAAADFSGGTATAFLQDQFKLTDQLTLQGGVRFEIYQGSDGPPENPNFVARHGFSNTETLNGRFVVMPRLGISYLPFDQLNVRAGAGLYSGGTPNVWVSNNYTNTGVSMAEATARDAATISGFDGRNIPQALQDQVRAGNGDTDALDPDFKIPSSWKVGAGADYAFDIPGLGAQGKGAELKVNYTFSKVMNGVTWKDLRRNLDSEEFPNNTPIGELPDGRPLYDPMFNPDRGVDMLLTNVSEGHGHVATVVLQKGFPFGLFVSGSYAFQRVYEVNPGTSSQSTSNYGLTAVSDPENPGNATSNYERAHRITAALEFSRALVGDLTDARPWKNMKTSFGLFVESRSGQPFSYTFGAPNSDTLAQLFGEEDAFAIRRRQLFYVPKGDGSDVILDGIDPDAFNAYLEKTGLDKYRGQIAPRNKFKSPWLHRFDVRLAQDLPNPLKGQRARVVLDIENVGNLLNSNWGRDQSVPFAFTAQSVDVAYDATQAKYVYSNLRSTNNNRTDVIASVWRMSLGLIYDF